MYEFFIPILKLVMYLHTNTYLTRYNLLDNLVFINIYRRHYYFV